MTEITFHQLKPEQFDQHLPALTDILQACVDTGASVGFIKPFGKDDAQSFWMDKIHPALVSQKRFLFIAALNGVAVGTVQLDIDLTPNQQHRGEVAKLLVHPEYRKLGIAKKLMNFAEDHARKIGRKLLTLDTRTGDSAEPLYQRLGYETAGVIPGYCRAVDEDRYDSTTYMYKAL